MPATVPIAKGFIFVLEDARPCKTLLDEYVRLGCTTLVEQSERALIDALLQVPHFESKAGKIAAYVKDAAIKADSDMVVTTAGTLEMALADKEYKLVIATVAADEIPALEAFLRYHLDHPNRPETPWIDLVVPVERPFCFRRSALELVEMPECERRLYATDRAVCAASVSMCPDTCRVDGLRAFDWDAFLAGCGGACVPAEALAIELCYRLGMSPKYGD